ncbi:GDSL esterase/lipase At4g10955-like [Silene latifolia]|uniref:GDSL esterase/lipase At4g10955-like n=1 Tax=Silene latifolia TaxID=37657 RepID=UPI003D787D11
MVKAPSKSELFDVTGPIHLNNVNWSEPNHRRSITASLTQGVYVLEHDRQQKRIDHNALAPIWWQFFDFRLIQMLEDHVDSSIVGAIFEYQPINSNQDEHIPPESRPPKYVIAFRGSLFKPYTQLRDGQLGAKLSLNRLTHDTRYQTSLKAAQEVISKAGAQNVWLAGHSLGAAIALQIGKSEAREGFLVDTYLFNPPYPSVPIEMLGNPKHKARFHLASSLLIAGLSVALKVINTDKNSSTTTGNYDPFTKLSTWIPNLFVNPYDPICCEYIGYFEHREKMKSWGVGGIERIAAKDTLVSLVSGAFGRDNEALHLIPSAVLVKNLHPKKLEFKIAHGIHQWWAPHLNLQSQTYNFS